MKSKIKILKFNKKKKILFSAQKKPVQKFSRELKQKEVIADEREKERLSGKPGKNRGRGGGSEKEKCKSRIQVSEGEAAENKV